MRHVRGLSTVDAAALMCWTSVQDNFGCAFCASMSMMGDKKMIAYWDEDMPVTSNNDLVKATLYKGLDEQIIAVANWSKKDQSCSLDIDWSKMGYEKSGWDYMIPAISGYQDEQSPASLNELIIPGSKGFLIILRKTDR